MKKLMIILLILTAHLATSQTRDQITLSIKDHTLSVSVQGGLTLLEVEGLFNLTDDLVPGRMRHYDRYIYANNTVYYRPGIAFFKKPSIYKKEDGVYRKTKKEKKLI